MRQSRIKVKGRGALLQLCVALCTQTRCMRTCFPEVACLARASGCPELFSAVKNDVIDGYYKKALDSHNVGEAVYRIAIDPKPKLRQSAPRCLCPLSWRAKLQGQGRLALAVAGASFGACIARVMASFCVHMPVWGRRACQE
jgi:hypothetical protein